MEAPNLLPMKGLFVIKFESKAICLLQKRSPQLWWLFSLWCFTQFGVFLTPIALKVVGPLLGQIFKDYSTIKAMKSTQKKARTERET